MMSLQELLGAALRPISFTDGTAGTGVALPFTWHDGRELVFFVEQVAERFRLFDDGLTLFHLSADGLRLDDARRRRPLHDRLRRHGVSLTQDGVIELWEHGRQLPVATARFISAMLELMTWERDNLGIPQEAGWLADEAELYLRAWKPQAMMKRDHEVAGLSGRSHRFDFLMDGELIDVIAPQAVSTGAELRKLADITQAPDAQPRRLRVVVDDRKTPERAKAECAILGAYAIAWPMSRLIATTAVPGRH